MKIIQLIGTRDKSDFALYLAHALTAVKKRVLVLDTTTNEIYRHGYTRLTQDKYIYELQQIDILCGVKNWVDAEAKLLQVDEKPDNYDCIILDTDNIQSILADWPKPASTLYLSDSERMNIIRDVPLLHRFLDNRFFDEYNLTELRQVHFESSYKLPSDYVLLLMNNRIEFSEESVIIDFDDLAPLLKGKMQHDQIIPYRQLSKEYKELLNEIACELFEDLDVRFVGKAARNSWFSLRPKKVKEEIIGKPIGG
ncbi:MULTISPECIES: ParA family protein [Bacillati]|uniref:ParA family protein n=1 Tax=Bacillati TaxID=1783272 RepID=UPI00343F77B3